MNLQPPNALIMKLTVTTVCLFFTHFISFAQTLPPPFSACPSTGFQVINNPTNFQTVNLATGTTTTVSTFAIYVNAIGYNPNDNRIYGIKQGSPFGVIVIGSDYTYQSVTTSGATLQSSVVGDVNPNGILWCLGSSNVYTVNCNSTDVTNFGKVTTIGAKPSVNITDWSFPATDNTKIYSVTNTGSLIYVKTSDLSVTTVLPAGTIPAESYGATYFDSNGNFYAKGNTSGTIYKFINVTGSSPTVITFSTSSTSGQNDGARCGYAPAPVIADYGDAPDSYGTFSGSGGPVHLLPSPNPTLAPIYFGMGITIDPDGNPAGDANLDTDDGISSFSAIAGGQVPYIIPSYAITVSVKNATASIANVSGWIDWNNNGVFETGEKVSTTISAGYTGNSTLTWNNTTLSGADGIAGTYARFRISTDDVSAPGGSVSNGEVEDYYIPFAAVLPVSVFSFNASAENAMVRIGWATTSEQYNKGFSIERSADGTTFNEIGFVPTKTAGGNSAQILQYGYYDSKPEKGINYYRLGETGIDGKLTYSQIIKVVFTTSGRAVVLYPNPAKNKITITGLKGNEIIQLYSGTGQMLGNEKANGVTKLFDINMLVPGVYRLVITDDSGNRITEKIIKQ